MNYLVLLNFLLVPSAFTQNLDPLKKIDQEIIQSNAQYMNCDVNSPEISLEEKEPYPGAKFQGPFFGIPRDNQDGLGTCYANTAKNLLVGLSRGDAVASFLDMALLYKDSKRELNNTESKGLDAGFSCVVLEEVSDKGFCSQSFAPIEIGEKNSYGGLMPEVATVRDQKIVLNMLNDYLRENASFSKMIINNINEMKLIYDTDYSKQNISSCRPVSPPILLPFISKWKALSDFLENHQDAFGDAANKLFSKTENMSTFLESHGQSTDLLLRPSRDLYQLIVAPACADVQNRKKLDFGIVCNRGYDTIQRIKSSEKTPFEQVKLLRERVVDSLLNGYPLGNSFNRHINTIVGVRFNKEANLCQYQIRESQTGTTSWQSEIAIFNKIRALTEVRRK